MKLLLKKEGININKANIFGKTALYLASDNGHAEIVKLLNQQKNLTVEDNELFKETLFKVINDDSKSIQNNEHMKMLVRVLYNLRDMEELLKLALKMSRLFPDR